MHLLTGSHRSRTAREARTHACGRSPGVWIMHQACRNIQHCIQAAVRRRSWTSAVPPLACQQHHCCPAAPSHLLSRMRSPRLMILLSPGSLCSHPLEPVSRPAFPGSPPHQATLRWAATGSEFYACNLVCSAVQAAHSTAEEGMAHMCACVHNIISWMKGRITLLAEEGITVRKGNG